MGLTLDEWRKLRNEGEEASLPSGLIVNLRRVSTMDLAEKGDIPAPLQTQLEEMISRQNFNKITLAEFKKFSGIINVVVDACLIGPEGLEANELDYQDRLAIFQWANEVGGKLQTFRKQPTAALELSRNGTNVLDAAQ